MTSVVAQTVLRLATCAQLAAIGLLAATLGACSKHETQTITPWLRVDVAKPRADDFIRVGSRREVYEIKRDGRWRKFGTGNLSRYMVVGEDTAVLLDLNDGNGLQLLQPDQPPRAIPASFGRAGTVYVPFPSAIDVVVTEKPRRTDVYRFDLAGTQTAQFQFVIPEAYSDCGVGEGLSTYGNGSVPYISAFCKTGSQQAKCLILGPNGLVHAVSPDADWSECDNFGKAGISTIEPARFNTFQ